MNQIQITQSNYSQILIIAKKSTSYTDLTNNLGYTSSRQVIKVRQLLLDNKFDDKIFSHPKKLSVLSDEIKLIEIIKKSRNFTDVLLAFKLRPHGSNSATLKKYIKFYKIDISHFEQYSGKVLKRNLQQIMDLLVPDSQTPRRTIKEYLIVHKLIPYICNGPRNNGLCGNTGSWLGEKFDLHLEHINGNGDDNSLNNLRFICPNCHYMTETWGARNKNESIIKENKPKRIESLLVKNKEIILNNMINFKTTTEILKLLKTSFNKANYETINNFINENEHDERIIKFLKNVKENQKKDSKIKLSSEKILKLFLECGNFEEIGRKLSCSGNTVKKTLKKAGFDMTPTGIKKILADNNVQRKVIMPEGYISPLKIISPSGQGWCSNCKKHKSLNLFPKCKINGGGAMCTQCSSASRAEYRQRTGKR